MHEKFNITGFFYEIQGYKFRKYLNIRKKNGSTKSPDLMVVMMNPGSSKPFDGIDENDKESEAVPDNTQDQIMRVMLKCGFEYARILNLSDLREGKSRLFYPKIDELDKMKIPHSVFDSSRREEFENLFERNVETILAWGVNPKLKTLANKALEKLSDETTIGVQKKNFEFAYYHPLPQDYYKQQEWVKRIIDTINKT